MMAKMAQNTINYSNEILKHKDQLRIKASCQGLCKTGRCRGYVESKCKSIERLLCRHRIKAGFVDVILARAMLYARLKQFQPL